MESQVGKIRSPAAPLFLSIITLGIYSFVWAFKIYREARDYASGRKGINTTSPGLAIGLLFIPGINIIWAIILLFKTPSLVTKMKLADGIPRNLAGSAAAIGWLGFIPVLGNIMWVILPKSAMNNFWRSVQIQQGRIGFGSAQMKKCPQCAEMIRCEARKCRYCQSEV